MENIKLITYENLSEHSEKIAHFSSTRQGGKSSGAFDSLNLGLYTEDKAENISHNRRLLCSQLGIDESQLHNAYQTHGKEIKIIDEDFLAIPPSERQSKLQGYDALITNLPQTCVTVTTADCVPVLLFDPVNHVVAAIHSGWKSTVQNICTETIQQMENLYGTLASDIIAAIGPCISQIAYEVGQDVYDAFEEIQFDNSKVFTTISNGKYLFDIRKAVLIQLQNAGINNIEVTHHCTFSDTELFFSARKQGINSGRMLSGIFLR